MVKDYKISEPFFDTDLNAICMAKLCLKWQRD